MQTINQTIRCSECGCISFPDSMYCPKCGASFRNNKINIARIEKTEPFRVLPDQEITHPDKSMIEAYFELICPQLGQVNIRTTFIIPR